VIKVQTVWPAIKDNAKEYFNAFEPYVDDIAINPLIDYLHKDEDIAYEDNFICPVLYQRLAIGSDGIVPLCSNDEFNEHTIGNVNTETIYSIWHGEKLKEAREIHERLEGVKLLAPCKQCYLPRKTKPVAEYVGHKKIIVDKYINRPDKVGA
jgi:radical SAM protein with 4Fe4S-binding SPASM domain